MDNFSLVWFSMTQKRFTNGFGVKSIQNRKKLKHTPLLIAIDLQQPENAYRFQTFPYMFATSK